MPHAEVGRITCEIASQDTWEAARPAGADDARSYLVVTVPVSVRSGAKADADLLVTVDLCAPRGHHPPVAHAPSPASHYTDVQLTRSGSVSLKPAVVELRGELGRTQVGQELVCDVTGVGGSRLEWTVSGRRRQLPGSQEFRFLVPDRDHAYSWVEARAELRPARRLRWRTPRTPQPSPVYAPLLAPAAAQAPATLVLHEGRPATAAPVFVGRPLNLALALGPDRTFLVRSTAREGAVGVIRWSDDVDGRPGYTWLAGPTVPVLLQRDGATVASDGRPVLLESGDVLDVDGQGRLGITYAAPTEPARPTLENCLEVRVVVDGAEISTHITASDYVTIGRQHRDVDIDRPDISRSHGALELNNSGWSYVQRSSSGVASIVRNGVQVARLHRGDTATVERGDVVELTDRVALVIE
ncbi:hypothetical protein SGLAM104S_04586 [Streptomyces glaucescens]